jgi:hypothetical protein
MILRVAPMTAGTEGVKRRSARVVEAPRSGRPRMTQRFFVINGIYGVA